jgi:regulator of replication initiation timing
MAMSTPPRSASIHSSSTTPGSTPAGGGHSAEPEDINSLHSQLKTAVQQRDAAVQERDALRTSLLSALQENVTLRAQVAELEERLTTAQAHINALQAQIDQLASSVSLHQTNAAELTDTAARKSTELLVGEAAARMDQRIMDFVWPGVRSQPHSRIKTTTNMLQMLLVAEEFAEAISIAHQAGTVFTNRRIREFGTAVHSFTDPAFADQAEGIKTRWEQVDNACCGFAGVLQRLKEYRIAHAHPGNPPAIQVLCSQLADLGNYSELVDELQELRSLEDVLSGNQQMGELV